MTGLDILNWQSVGSVGTFKLPHPISTYCVYLSLKVDQHLKKYLGLSQLAEHLHSICQL